VFKQLLKLFLTEVYLFISNGHLWTYNQLINYQSDPYSIRLINQKILNREIEKVQYQCIKIVEPFDINNNTFSKLKIKLINVNKKGDFISMYDSIVEGLKTLGLFYDYDQTKQNSIFILENKF